MIVDASVAIKWFADETDSERAIELAVRETVGAPHLIFAEVANALWKKWRTRELIGPVSFSTLDRSLDWWVEDRLLAQSAFELASEVGHPVYDCFYLALAIERDMPMVTADERFLRALAPTRHAPRALHLRDWA